MIQALESQQGNAVIKEVRNKDLLVSAIKKEADDTDSNLLFPIENRGV